MTRDTYQTKLQALRSDVLAMNDLVVERLEMGLESFANGDETTARKVVEGDDEVNEAYLALEKDCVDLFALQQPVAGLRPGTRTTVSSIRTI